MPTDPMYPHVTICLALAAVRIPIVRHRCQHRTHTKCSSTPRQWRFIIIDLSLGVSGFTDVVLSKAEASIPYRSSRGCVARERKDRHHMVTTHHTPHTAHRTPHTALDHKVLPRHLYYTSLFNINHTHAPLFLLVHSYQDSCWLADNAKILSEYPASLTLELHSTFLSFVSIHCCRLLSRR